MTASKDVRMASEIKLVVFDMEGTLTDLPTVWELMHLKIGTWESHGLPYWEEFKRGGMGYDEFARKDVATWRGAPTRLLDEAVHEVPLMDGCEELLRFLNERGIASAIVSNGLDRLANRLAAELPVARVAANRECVTNGNLTGELDVLVPFHAKADAMRQIASELGIEPEEIMAVGDGVADIGMFRAAGSSVAFMPENAEVAAAADCVLRDADLRNIMALFG